MKPNQKLVSADGIELAGYPKENMKISEWIFTSPDHIGVNNFDDGGADLIYAPSDIVLKYVDHTTTGFHAVIAWSKNKVKWADGSYDYFTMSVKHSNDVSTLAISQEYKQGTPFYKGGGWGAKGARTYGAHTHICFAKGHTTKYITRSSGKQDLSGSVDPSRLLFINDTNLISTKGVAWKTYITPNIVVGSTVRIIGKTYATGQPIPFWVKLKSLTVLRFDTTGTKVLLKQIMSWVYLKDVVLK